MKKDKIFYCLINSKGIKQKYENGKYILFEYPQQAIRYISKHFGGSKYITIKKYKRK